MSSGSFASSYVETVRLLDPTCHKFRTLSVRNPPNSVTKHPLFPRNTLTPAPRNNVARYIPKNRLLAGGYALAALMALGIMFLPVDLGPLALVFMLGGVQVAIEETLEDAFCAELVEPAQHGMAFGVLATVNGIGDFLSSAVVGLLWSALGQTVAFGYSAVPFLLAAVLTLQVHPPMSSSGSQPVEC
jgi:hypothetical protein